MSGRSEDRGWNMILVGLAIIGIFFILILIISSVISSGENSGGSNSQQVQDTSTKAYQDGFTCGQLLSSGTHCQNSSSGLGMNWEVYGDAQTDCPTQWQAINIGIPEPDDQSLWMEGCMDGDH